MVMKRLFFTHVNMCYGILANKKKTMRERKKRTKNESHFPSISSRLYRFITTFSSLNAKSMCVHCAKITKCL